MKFNTENRDCGSCGHCGYDLRGLPEPRCPECGNVHDPILARRRLVRRRWAAFILTFTALYAPFIWIPLSHDDPSYVATWMRMWPVLPGFVPGFVLRPLVGKALCLVIMGVLTIAELLFFTWLASCGRSWWGLWRAIVALMYACFNSWIALQVFQA